MFSAQLENVENSLYAALRALEENEELARRIAKRARKSKQHQIAERFEAQAESNAMHARQLRDALTADDGYGKKGPRPEEEPEDIKVHRGGNTDRTKAV
jgi:rubrerythrin